MPSARVEADTEAGRASIFSIEQPTGRIINNDVSDAMYRTNDDGTIIEEARERDEVRQRYIESLPDEVRKAIFGMDENLTPEQINEIKRAYDLGPYECK